MIALPGLVDFIGSTTERSVRYLDYHHWFFGIMLIGCIFRLYDKSIHARFSALHKRVDEIRKRLACDILTAVGVIHFAIDGSDSVKTIEGSVMSAAEPLFCFTSDRIETHPCPNCRAPMTSISSTSSRSNFEERTFQCFNCDSADRSSFPQLGACQRYEARIAAASTDVRNLTPGIAGNDVNE
jgi:hypothetical protein